MAGLLHAISNSTQDLGRAMPDFEEFATKTSSLCNLLRRRMTKQRLLATCFADPPASAWAQQVQSFDASCVQHRWGSLLAAAQELRGVRDGLRFVWDLQKYSFNNGRPQERADGNDPWVVDIGRCDAAISSEFFWAYLDMVLVLGHCIDHISCWCESCPCHSGLAAFDANTYHLRRQLFTRGGSLDAMCPMRTRRAPEVAAGSVHRILSSIFQTLSCTLLVSLAARLPSDQKKPLLDNFAAGRAQFSFFFRGG